MIRFLFHRLFFQALPTLFVLAALSFLLVRLAPGSPFASERELPPQTLEALNRAYGLDQPVPVQFFRYLSGVVRGDFGPSLRMPGRTVAELILAKLPVSLELGFWSLLYAVFVGLTLGVLAAVKPNGAGDHVAMTLALLGICIPAMVMGPVLALIFGLRLEWLPVMGWHTPADRILPVITLGSTYASYIARLARGGMLEELTRDYIRTARSKGLSEAGILVKHALRGGVQPVVSFLGPAAAGLLTGAFVVEQIFFIPGLGETIVNAALNRDQFVILGCVLLFGSFMVFFNTLVDVALAALNPRIRMTGGKGRHEG
ncbi:MAG: ABC transporter permease [Verrucomicrobia bacterium]|nr:ABC transporter permease [Verrucomicrobiota bacterium]MCH8526694.1 ABC transporter permease [Kiritimatiellia bacterium]